MEMVVGNIFSKFNTSQCFTGLWPNAHSNYIVMVVEKELMTAQQVKNRDSA